MTLRPPAGAVAVAKHALSLLPVGEQPPLAAKIAAGSELTAHEIEIVADFHAQPAQDTDSYRLAAALLGGRGLHRAVVAAASQTVLPAPEPCQCNVTAGAFPRGFPELNKTVAELNRQLERLDRDTIAEVRTAIQMAYSSSLDRIGRMATRASADSSPLRAVSAKEAAIIAAPTDLAEIKSPAKLIAPAIQDAVSHIRLTVARAQRSVEAMIGDSFAVDLTVDWPDITDSMQVLADGIEEEVLYRAGITDSANIDPSQFSGDPLQAPFGLTRSLMAQAGGADGRDAAGRPISADGTTGTDGIGLGPLAVSAITQSILEWRTPDGVTAASTRRRPGANISARLSSDLARAAESLAPAVGPPKLVQIVENIWRLDWNGTTVTEHFEPHENLAGTVVVADGDLASIQNAENNNDWPEADGYHPGDHRYCHCGWETIVRFVDAV